MAICPQTCNIVIDNLMTGYDLYPGSNFSSKKHFAVDTTERFVKDAWFAENGEVFVAGSDHGKAYVFEIGSGCTRQVMKHGSSNQLIQAIGVSAAVAFLFSLFLAVMLSWMSIGRCPSRPTSGGDNRIQPRLQPQDLEKGRKPMFDRSMRLTFPKLLSQRQRQVKQKGAKASMLPTLVKAVLVALFLWCVQDIWYLPARAVRSLLSFLSESKAINASTTNMLLHLVFVAFDRLLRRTSRFWRITSLYRLKSLVCQLMSQACWISWMR